MELHELHSPRGATKGKKIRGRGPGSGHGKTSCRGHKGLKARSGGGLRAGFEGGQMPLIRRIPKRGFNSPKRKIYFQIVNLESLKKFKADTPVTPELLEQAGLIRSKEDPVKILGTGELAGSLTIKAHAFSEGAKEKIKKAGGTAEEIK